LAPVQSQPAASIGRSAVHTQLAARPVVRSIGRLRGGAATVVVHLLVGWVYLWFATGGKYEFRSGGAYYGLMADAFLAGQVYLKITPPPELATLADPYEPAQYASITNRLPDGAYYNGKYYMYWGPVPGVIHAAWQAGTGNVMQENLIMFVFGLVGCLAFWAIVRELRNLAFPKVSDWWVRVVYLSGTLGGVGLYLQARPIIHHEAIVAASMFALSACYFWLRALRSNESAWVSLAISSLLFGLAVGSRITDIVYLVGGGIVLASGLLVRGSRRRSVIRLLAYSVPSSILIALLLGFNYVRFNSFLEFGTRYVQTGIQNLNKSQFGVFDPRVIPNNILAYLEYLPWLSAYFPWVVYSDWVPPVSNVGYAVEPPFASVLLLGPLLVFLPVSVIWAMGSWRQQVWASRQAVVGVSIGVVGSIALVLTTNWASGRYMQEFFPFAYALSALGLWWVVSSIARPRWAQLARTLSVALVSWSAIAGGMLGVWELGFFPDMFQGIAYPVDAVEARVARQVAGDSWQATYLSDVTRRRPWGVFYPDASVVSFSLPSRARVSELNMWSVFSHKTTVNVTVNGIAVGTWPVESGQVRITFPQPLSTSDDGVFAIQLGFPHEPAADPPLLWPITINNVTQVGP
jgi:hypothetical protein